MLDAQWFTEDAPITFNITKSTLPDNGVRLQLRGVVPRAQINTLSVRWHFNGQSLPSGTSLSALRKLSTHISQTLEIEKFIFLHSGVYEALLYINAYTYLRQYGCDDNYPRFISNTLDDSNVLVKVAVYHLEQDITTTTKNDQGTTCEPEDSSSTDDRNTAGVIAGAFIGGLFAGVLFFAIPTIIVW